MGDKDQKYNFEHSRTVVHIDIDCFYAQVEMIRNQLTPDIPLGVQQKSFVVTCNYKARELGVTKLMKVDNALKKCPELKLVCGEDLTNYRGMSYKITAVLQEFSPLVERLGFDENFIDVTDIVGERLTNPNEENQVVGHVYENLYLEDDQCDCGCHQSLTLGSHIAQEMRDAIFQKLGLTCCAGIAHNKLLSKLVAGHRKPNQQTVLFPESVDVLLNSLESVRSIPGIGGSTQEKLTCIGIVTLQDLRNCSIKQLEEIFGMDSALQMMRLSHGIDDSPVTPTGKPQSHSLEDTFQKCTTIQECKSKLQSLIGKLLIRIIEDKRIPQTLRLTVRRKTTMNGMRNVRECRQCPLSYELMSQLADDELTTVHVQRKVLDLLLKLLVKMVPEGTPFCLNLLGVCFTKFREPTKLNNPIRMYFTDKILANNTSSSCENDDGKYDEKEGPMKPISQISESFSKTKTKKQNTIMEFLQAGKRPRDHKSFYGNVSSEQTTNTEVPEDVDQEVFQQLPLELREELIQSWKVGRQENGTARNITTNNHCCTKIPSNVDQTVFNALPHEMKTEIMKSWKSSCHRKSESDSKRRKSSILDFFQKT